MTPEVQPTTCVVCGRSDVPFFAGRKTCNRCRNSRSTFLKANPDAPHGAKRPTELSLRLLGNRRIDENACWNWTGAVNDNGYGKIAYFPEPNERVWTTVHRLAAHVWLALDLESKAQVNHDCDNRLCFNPDHIYIGTQKQNVADCLKRGRRANVSGRLNPAAKLTEESVLAIREESLNAQRGTKSALSRKYGISTSLITKIAKGERWKHLKS